MEEGTYILKHNGVKEGYGSTGYIFFAINIYNDTLLKTYTEKNIEDFYTLGITSEGTQEIIDFCMVEGEEDIRSIKCLVKANKLEIISYSKERNISLEELKNQRPELFI